MSKWKNLETGNTFGSYEEVCDEIYDNLLFDDVIEYIMETSDDYDVIAALNGNKPDFYTDKFMELADRQCADYIVEIPDEEEEDTEEN